MSLSFAKILVVDDEIEILNLLDVYLTRERFTVLRAANGREALAIAKTEKPDLVVLDLMLPDSDGVELCKTLRAELIVPIVILSAKGEEPDKVLGLGVGADDYVTKPFSPSELVARVKAHLRQFARLRTAGDESSLVLGPLEIDLRAYEVRLGGRSVALTTKEFQLLRFMAARPNQVFSREQLYESVWGWDAAGDARSVSVYVQRLRHKLGPKIIETVWGAGYKFVPPQG